MKNIFSKISPPGKHAFLSALTLCLLLFFIVRCSLYAEQNSALAAKNEELSSALADRNQTIHDKAGEMEKLQKQLAESISMEEYKTETGFYKKGGVYLIDWSSQLWTLRQMIAEGTEIEPGVSAASAAYRLRDSITLVSDPFCLGTEENPFCGSFDGDGHYIDGFFSKSIFHTDTTAAIKNLKLYNQADQPANTGIYTVLDKQWKCLELERCLPDFPDCSAQIKIEAWNLDIQQTAEILRKNWEQNSGRDSHYVSMTFCPESDEPPADQEVYLQKVHTALITLAGAEYSRIIDEVLAQEEGYLWSIRLERIDQLTCCTFEIGKPSYQPNIYGRTDDSYYILAEGNWEGTEVPRQCLHIPYTDSEKYSIGIGSSFEIESVDLNFDGKQDLLIHEGFSGGSGGSWQNYRAYVWEADTGQFAYFPSFPEQISFLELDRQRIVNHGRSGYADEYVVVYEIVNGEYMRTKELTCREVQRDDGTVIELSYYEMGKLVETHILSDWSEKEALYPDLDYWFKG